MSSNVREDDYSCKTLAVNNHKFYQCKTCDISEEQYICEQCLMNGNHVDHQYTKITHVNITRFCNCGDSTGQFHCTEHKAMNYPDGVKPLYLDSDALDKYVHAFKLNIILAKKLSRLNQIIYVTPSSVDGKITQTYFDNTNAHQIKLNLKMCWSVYRKDHEQNFCDKGYDKTRRLLLWHGTKRKNLDGILENGFRKPTQSGDVSSGSMFGKGVYFADRVSKSANYTDKDGYELLFLCEVALGSMWRTGLPKDYKDVPPKYHSIKGVGKKIPDRSEEEKFNGINVPLGKTIDCKLDKIRYSELNYNEYIVFDPDRILIKYIIAFKSERNTCAIS